MQKLGDYQTDYDRFKHSSLRNRAGLAWEEFKLSLGEHWWRLKEWLGLVREER